jgi:hypothetical protein
MVSKHRGERKRTRETLRKKRRKEEEVEGTSGGGQTREGRGMGERVEGEGEKIKKEVKMRCIRGRKERRR